jgi:hypothetical protein
LFVTSSRDGKLGFLALQHHHWKDKGGDVDWRTCIMATRVVNRDDDDATDTTDAGEGGYDLDPRATGDVVNVFAWPGSLDPAPAGRALAGFSWAWAAVVAKEKKSTAPDASPNKDPDQRPNDLDGPIESDPLSQLGIHADGTPAPSTKSSSSASYPPLQNDLTDDAAAGGPEGQPTDKPASFHLLPVLNDRWEPDTSYDSVEVLAAADQDGNTLVPKYAIGTRGILLAGSDNNAQFPLFFPCDNRLTAPNFAGDPTTGTLVADTTSEAKIDPARTAHLQSMMRVIKGPYAPEPDVMKSWGEADGLTGDNNVLAWNLGGSAAFGGGYDQLTGLEDSFAGWVWMTGPAAFEGGGPHLCREEAHGPFAMGCCANHRLAVDGDGNPIFPLHQHLGTLWTFNNRYEISADNIDTGYNGFGATGSGAAGVCGPMIFEGPVKPAVRGPYVNVVHLRFDAGARHDWFDSNRPGAWRWQADSYFTEPDQPDTPTPGQPPPPPPWDPTTGQPPYPGRLPPEDPDPGDPDFGFIPQPDIWDPIRRQKLGLPLEENYPPLGPTGPINTPPRNPPPDGGDPGGGDFPFKGEGGGDIVPGGIPRDTTSPGYLRERGWLSIAYTDGVPPTMTPTQGGERDRFAATGIMTSFPGFLFRPQYFSNGVTDYRHWMEPDPALVKLFDRTAPVVLRMEAYGAQGATPGGPFLTTSTGIEYTTLPRTQRYPGGSGPGGVVYLSADSDMSLIDQDLDPGWVEASPGHVLAGPNVYWGAGLPNLADGGVLLGYRWGADPDGNLSFDRVDGTGELVFSLILPQADGAAGDALLTDGAGQLYFSTIVPGASIVNALGPVGTPADTAQHTLLSTTISAGTITAPKTEIQIEAWGTFAANANVKTVALLVGGVPLVTNDVTTAPNGLSWRLSAKVVQTATPNTQTCFASGMVGAGPQTTLVAALNNPTAAPIVVAVAGQNGTAAANDIVAQGLETSIAEAA